MQKVIAIDFDGTLCENKYPEIGLPRWGVIFKALSEQENGAALILWTCRTGKELNDAVEACAKWGLTFDAVNKNLPSWVDTWNNDPRKVGATEYWDDRAKSTIDATDFGKLESKVNGYEIETRPIACGACRFETRVTHQDFNDEDATWLEGYNLTDSVEGEIRLVTMDIDVSIHGQELHLLTDEQKNVIAIATADDLAPLQGEFASSAYMAFYLRTSSQGEKYIVVKDGFSVRAAIMQPDVKEALRDSLLEALTLLRVEGLKDGTVDITRQCWPTGGNEETEADDEET